MDSNEDKMNFLKVKEEEVVVVDMYKKVGNNLYLIYNEVIGFLISKV